MPTFIGAATAFQMKWSWKYLKSFVAEEVVERTSSPYNERLEVWYVYGKLTLNARHVNLSFGQLDTVFRSAFQQLEIGRRDVQDVLLLGLGAGNVVKLLAESGKEYAVTGVEIDAEVIRLARKYFELDTYKGLEVVCADAWEFLQTCTSRYDLVIVDLFVDAIVPEHAEQAAFLKRAAAALRPGGLLLFNRLMLDAELREQTEAFTRNMEAVLPGTRYIKAQKNRMLIYEK
ncbi:MAG: fused MFS/spermidine synthase [Bacteroidota bacterium]